MGGKQTGEVAIPLNDALSVATAFLNEGVQSASFEDAFIAGSIRRECSQVHDIDVVIVPNENTDEWLRAHFGTQKNGKPRRTGVVSRIQVDVICATAESVGAALMHLTGPVSRNIRQRNVARSKGLLLNEKGLWRGKERVAGRTEEEVYMALGLQFIAPEER